MVSEWRRREKGVTPVATRAPCQRVALPLNTPNFEVWGGTRRGSRSRLGACAAAAADDSLRGGQAGRPHAPPHPLGVTPSQGAPSPRRGLSPDLGFGCIFRVHWCAISSRRGLACVSMAGLEETRAHTAMPWLTGAERAARVRSRARPNGRFMAGAGRALRPLAQRGGRGVGGGRRPGRRGGGREGKASERASERERKGSAPALSS